MYNFNRLWSGLKGVSLSKLVQRECDIPLLLDLFTMKFLSRSVRQQMAQTLLIDRLPALQGAMYGSESRRFLAPVSTAPIATTGANNVVFNVFDFTLINEIGFVWTVAGTVTALTMDFDLHDQLAAGNLLTDKLDVTNGVIVSPSVAGQTIGAVLYKDIGETGPVLIQPGYSINANVTVTTTAGNGAPFVIGYPKPEEFANLPTARRQKSA
jgi:hypothetical protein